MSRGVDGRAIFHDDGDRRVFLGILGETKNDFGLKLFAYCLMGNHFHLLLRVGDSPLQFGMHRFLTRYSHYFNQRHKRQGHLFQSRYTAPVCDQGAYLFNLPRYIHLNPVRAGLVAAPDLWPWSGHRGLAGTSHDPLLDKTAFARLTGTTEADLEARYADALETVGAGRRAPSLGELALEAARRGGISVSALLAGRRGKRLTEAKLRFIALARGSGYQWTKIAAVLNCSPAGVTLLWRRKVKFVPDPFVKSRGWGGTGSSS